MLEVWENVILSNINIPFIPKLWIIKNEKLVKNKLFKSVDQNKYEFYLLGAKIFI